MKPWGLASTLRGAPDGAPILFLHGFMGTGGEWTEVADVLRSEYRCLLVDLPGHGETPMCEDLSVYEMEGAARAVEALMDTMGWRDAHVVGYSMGARLALYMALNSPDRCRRVVMESGSPGLMQPDEAWTRQRVDDGWASRFEQEPLERVVDAWYRQPLFASLISDHALYEMVRLARCANRPGELARSMRGMSTGRQTPLWDRLYTLTKDVLAIYGEHDGKYRSITEYMGRLSTRVTTAMIPAAGHNIHVEQPEAFADRLRTWLSA